MIRQYFMFSSVLDFYASISSADYDKKSGELYLLFMSFNPYRDWIFLDKGDDEVFITQHFVGDSEDEDVVIKLSLKNYNYIAHQWDKVIEQKPKFFMLSRDDSGWIDLELKNQLSEEDQKYLDQDALKKLT